VTPKKLVIIVVTVIVIAAAALVVQVMSHRSWEKGVWSCYAALGSGEAALANPLILPAKCSASAIAIRDLGKPTASVSLLFRPPTTMWVSHLMRTVEYDSYVIEISGRDSVVRAKMHHGSD